MNTVAEIVESKGGALRRLSPADQLHLMREIERDPAMGRRVAALLAGPDPEKAIMQDAVKASINQLEPSRFAETAGAWPVLRDQISAVPAAVHATLGREIPSLSFEEKISLLNWISSRRRGAGMGSLGDIFSDLWGSVGEKALEEGMNYYTEKMKADALRDIKEMELQVQREVGLKKLEMEQALAEKKMEYELMLQREREATQAPAESGLPSWVLPAGIGVLGLITTLVVVKMTKK